MPIVTGEVKGTLTEAGEPSGEGDTIEAPPNKAKNDDGSPERQEHEEEDGQPPGATDNGRVTRSGRSGFSPPYIQDNTKGNFNILFFSSILYG